MGHIARDLVSRNGNRLTAADSKMYSGKAGFLIGIRHQKCGGPPGHVQISSLVRLWVCFRWSVFPRYIFHTQLGISAVSRVFPPTFACLYFCYLYWRRAEKKARHLNGTGFKIGLPMRTLKRLIIFLLAGGLLVAGWITYQLNAPVQLPVIPYEFSIKQGSSLTSVANQLADAGVLDDARLFILLSRMKGLASSVKAGDYEFAEPITPLELLNRITKGDISQSEIKFIEGWTFSQLRQTLDEHPALRHDTANLSSSEILQLIGATETAAEGLFFPDTYFFARGSSDTAILKRAYKVMQNHLNTAWGEREPDLPLKNPYQALILASIVEKETGREKRPWNGGGSIR